jgi:SagB-type dehydrogenase family enzyme
MSISLIQYHNLTSYQRDKITGHYLDWENQPALYKTYPDVEPFPLPRDVQLPDKKLSSLLKEKTASSNRSTFLNIDDLSRIFLLTYSLTSRVKHSGREFFYRSAASAGALYPTEIYVAVQRVKGVDDGLYHFSVAHHGLFPLRKGNFFPQIAKAILVKKKQESVLTFFLSVIFFRSTWKYRERAYRYLLLDTGHLLENLVLALRSLDLLFLLSYEFDDQEVNRLLGFDQTKEVSLATSQVLNSVFSSEEGLQEKEELSENFRKASHMAKKEVDYPIIREIHTAGYKMNLVSESKPDMVNDLGISPKNWTEINQSVRWPETLNYPGSVFQRRSRRNYLQEPISHDCLLALLNCLKPSDFENAAGSLNYFHSLGIGLLIGRAEGFAPGFYLIDIFSAKVGMVKAGFFIDIMSHVCLDQTWLSSASLLFLFLTNLETLDHHWGPRGYRYALMTAGRLGERLYLTATAMGIGCCGIGAFYDDEAVKLLDLNSHSRLIYLVTIGPIRNKKL